MMHALQPRLDPNAGRESVHGPRSLVEMVTGLLPQRLVFPPVVESRYKDARARSWWKRDVLGYLLFLLLVSPIYVITTSYLDRHTTAAAAAAAAAAGSDKTAPLQQQHHAAYHSKPQDAPTAAAYNKLTLYPSYTTAAAAAVTGSNTINSSAAAAAPSATKTSRTDASISRIASALLRPKQLALLYKQRLSSCADVALLVKVAAAAGALLLALGCPGLYCKHQVRTAVVAVYLTAPLLLLPMQLLARSSSSSGGGSSVHSTAAAAYGSWLNASGMQGYVVLLSYAPVIVLGSSILHPLPLMWQAVVNCLSWGSLTVTAVMLRLKYTSTASAAAASSSSSSVQAAETSMHAGELSFRLAFGVLDGLLLSVLLPLLFSAWSSRRARKHFLLSGSLTGSSDAMGQQQQQQQSAASAISQTARSSRDGILFNTEQGTSLISDDSQASSAVQESGANAAAAAAAAVKSSISTETPSNPVLEAAAGQLYVIRRISLPKAAAAAAGSGSSAAVHLDQPPTPTMALESRIGSNSSRSAGPGLTPSDQSDSSVTVIPRYDTTDDSTGSRSETCSNSGGSSSATEPPAVAAAAAADRPGQQQQQQGGVAVPGSRAQTHLHRRYPQRPSALYRSSLETVVVSLKLSADGARPAAAAAAATVPVQSHASQAAGVAGTSLAAAAADAPVRGREGSSRTMHGRTAAAAAAAAGSSVGAGSQLLKSQIEAAVRQVVAASDYQVLCTSVSAFPGCVHVVMSLQLYKGGDMAAQLAAAAAAAAEAGEDFVSMLGTGNAAQTTSSSSVCDINWDLVVQELQQCKLVDNADSESITAAAAAVGGDNAGGEAAAAAHAEQQLQLQYMLVQDGAGTDQWYWEAPAEGSSTGVAAAAAARMAPAATAAFGDRSRDTDSKENESSSQGVIHDESSRRITPQPASSDGSSENLQGRVHDDSSEDDESRDSLDSSAAIPINPIDSSVSCATSRSAGSAQAMLTPWQQHLLLQQHGSENEALFSSFDPRCSVPFTVQEDPDQAAAAAAVVHVAAAVRGNAHGVVMTGFTLPSDQAWLETFSGPSLIVPESLAASLAAAAAGLRVVITAAAAAAGECGGTSLVDITYWSRDGSSGSSSNASSNAAWPENHSISLVQLLLANIEASRLVYQYGPVLAVNILATPAKAAAAAAAAAPPGSSSSSTLRLRECLLLQLPLLLVPGVVCEALSDLSDIMSSYAVSHESAYHQHLLPLVRDMAMLLLGPTSNTLQPLAAAAASHSGVHGDLGSGPATPMHHHQQQQQQHTSDAMPAVFIWLAENVLRYLHSQGLRDAAAVLGRLIQDSLPAPAAAAVAAVAAAVAAESPANTQHGSENSPVSSEIDPKCTAAAAAGSLLQQQAGGMASDDSPVHRSSLDDSAHSSGSESNLNLADFLTKQQAKDDKSPSAAAAAEAKSDQFLVSEALKAAAAAAEEAQTARSTAVETSAALAAALQSLSRLSATAAAAAQQAQRAESAAAMAAQRAAAAEARSERQRALYLIGGGHVEGGALGQGMWGLLGAATGRRNAAAAAEVFSSPPVLPVCVTSRDVLFGFSDERLEIQYRRLKALQVRVVDKAALIIQVLREATIVWKIGRALHAVSDTRLSLVLLCKYEAVTLLPYLMSLTCPDFWIQHRNFMLMLSQIACALTVGMITATEIYRQEWAQLLHPQNTLNDMLMAEFEPGTSEIRTDVQQDLTLISRPFMLIVWFYLVVPLLQQLCVPDQLVACVAQAVQSYLVYRFIFKGGMGSWWLMGWLGVGAVVSLGLVYLSDLFMRRQAVAAARRSLAQSAT